MTTKARPGSFLRRRMLWLSLALAVSTLPLTTATRAAAEPAPQTFRGTLTLEVTCTPDTFQPNVWVVSECVTRISNNSHYPVPVGYVSVRSTGGTTIPDYYWMSYVRNGEEVPVGSGDLSFEVDRLLQPGESSQSRLLVLLRMREGTWQGDDTVFVGEEEAATTPVELVASDDAAAPSQDLLITKTLVEETTPDGGPPSTATYETKVTNRGSATLTDLKIIDRAEYVELTEADPGPVTRSDELSLYTWDLASFGRESLPPGESLVLRMSYAPAADYDCASVDTGTIVEATVDGKTERYGVCPDEQPQLGECRSIDDEEGSFVPGGRGGPVGFGRGGEGPGDSTFDLIWAAMCLAAGGAALVGLAALVRRRVRR